MSSWSATVRSLNLIFRFQVARNSTQASCAGLVTRLGVALLGLGHGELSATVRSLENWSSAGVGVSAPVMRTVLLY